MKNSNTNKTKLFTPNSRPKTVTMTFTRGANGSYHMERATYNNVVNQHVTKVTRLDARDATSELRAAVKRGLVTVR